MYSFSNTVPCFQ